MSTASDYRHTRNEMNYMIAGIYGLTRRITCRVSIDRVSNAGYKCVYELMKTECNEAISRLYLKLIQKTQEREMSSLDCVIG